MRTWVRRPGFAAVVIATLAIGIGANVAVYTVIDGVLLRPFPYRAPENLGVIQTHLPLQDTSRLASSGPELFALRNAVDALESVAAIWYRPGALTDDAAEPEDIDMGFISAGFLRTLGLEPALGHFVADDEDVLNGPNVIVLSHGLWQRRYGGDRDIIGERVGLEDVPHTVIGVMPDGYRMLFPPEAGVPEHLAAWVPWGGGYDEMRRKWRIFTVIARLADDLDFTRANAELSSLAADLRENFPQDYQMSGLELELLPLGSSTVAHVRPALLILLGAVGFVFLVACANVANLMLVRALGTDREMALRVALGANRLRLMRQLAIESAVLSFAGAALGIVFASVGVEALKFLDPGRLPRLADVTIGGNVLLLAVVVAIATAVLFGIVSSVHVSHGSAALRVGARSPGDVGRQGVRRLLVASEIALSVVLLTGAGLLARSFIELSKVDPGFETSAVVSVKLSLVDSHFPYTKPPAIADFYRVLAQRLDELPEVRAVGATSQLPLDGTSFSLGPYSYDTPEGVIEWESVAANFRLVTPGFFEAMRARLLEGRWFEWTDDLEHPNVVVIDDTLARRAFPNRSAVGGRLLIQAVVDGELGRDWAEIVGVVAHLKQHPSQDPVEQIYVPHPQQPTRTMALVIRSTMTESALMDAVRVEVGKLDRQQPVHAARNLDAYFVEAMAPTRFALSLLTVFAIVAVVVAAIGIYGVMSYSVRERWSEIGVRLALGATPWRIRRTIVLEGAVVVAGGVALGMISAFGFSRFLASELYGITPTDPLTFAVIPAILSAIALGAVYLSAHRASNLDATLALRGE